MFTSGTTGPPKLVVHSLAGLTGAIKPAAADAAPPVWGTFYDIRRYGGLQILLRALLGEGSLAITAPAEPMPAFLTRLARLGVTHLTGTPSHWRRVLMTPEASGHRAGLRAALRRDRRPGGARRAEGQVPRRRPSATPTPPPRPASASR